MWSLYLASQALKTSLASASVPSRKEWFGLVEITIPLWGLEFSKTSFSLLDYSRDWLWQKELEVHSKAKGSKENIPSSLTRFKQCPWIPIASSFWSYHLTLTLATLHRRKSFNQLKYIFSSCWGFCPQRCVTGSLVPLWLSLQHQ